MAGRNVKFVTTIPGRCALSVNDAGMPTPKGWAWTLLSDIARLESGHTPSRSRPEYWDGDIAWIGIKDAREHHGGVINDTSQHVTQAGIDNSAARLLPAKTVCLSRTASVGYVVVMGRPMATSQDFVNWICSPAIEPDYLKWIFRAEGEEGLRKFGKGTTHTTIYFPEVEAFHACIAPLNEQRRIVAKLDAVLEQTRAAKARLERLPALIEKLKRSILAAAFRGDLTKDWRAANPNVEPADQMLTNGQPASAVRRGVPERVHLPDMVEAWELPSTWTRHSVAALLHGGALVDVKDGNHGANHPKTSEFSESGLPFVTAAQVSAFRIDYEGAPKIDGLPLKRLRVGFAKAGDAVLTHKGTVGRTAVCDRDCVLTPQTTYYRCRLGLLDPWFVAYFMAAPQFVAQYTPVMSQTTRNFVPISGQYELFLAVPPFAEQQVIVGRLARVLEKLRDLEVSVESMLGRVSALGEAALAKAFRGELVPQDPTDEPAAVLIDRIRAMRAADAEPRRTRRRDSATTAEPDIQITGNGHTTSLQHDASLDLVLATFQVDRRLTATAIAEATGLNASAVKKAIKSLVEAGQLRAHGATYEWTR